MESEQEEVFVRSAGKPFPKNCSTLCWRQERMLLREAAGSRPSS